MTKNTKKSAVKLRPGDQAEPIDVLAALAGLRAMTVPELQAKWAAIFDAPAPNASRGNLELRLGYRLQELALGGLSRQARRTLDALADEVVNGAPGPMVADPRRPMPGTRLVRDSPYSPRGNVVSVEEAIVCNLYSQTKAQEAMRRLFTGLEWSDRAGNLEPGSIYPDRLAPIVRHAAKGLELVRALWGMPSPPSLLKTERDPGVTNVRNLASPHWRRWLGPAHRCLVPVTSFAEPKTGGNQWFGPTELGKPMFIAGIEVRGWKSLRKVKDGPTIDDLYAFLTCPPNAEVGAVHPKAMPVILTEPDEWDTWLSAPFEIAATLQRPLLDGALRFLDDPI